MGRRKLSESEGLSDISSKSENFSPSPQLESPPRKKLKKKYKKSHKYKLSESEYSETETEYIEKKKHKHRHKKHKSHRHRSEHYEENESYKRLKRRHRHHSSTHETRSKHHKHNAEIENRNRHSSHKKRERERYRIIEDYPNREVEEGEEEEEQESNRWDDNEEENETNLLTTIKTEPGSNSDEERRSESRSTSQRNHVDKKEQKEKTDKWGKDVPIKNEENTEPKETVNFGLSGKLTEDANTYNGVVIKYSQPPEARKPKRRWRWYIFKGDEELPFLPLHRQSAYLIGRERKVADIPTDHPSCSKQHAVLQYRLVSYQREDGTVGRTVKPYILDLESANGTYVNNRRIDARRYVELLEKDVVKFGYSSREYVLLHEASKGSDEDMPDVGTDLSPVSLLRAN